MSHGGRGRGRCIAHCVPIQLGCQLADVDNVSRSFAYLFALAMVASMAVGCSTGSSRASSGASRSMCSLVPASLVGQILGRSVTAYQRGLPAHLGNECDYVAKPGAFAVLYTVPTPVGSDFETDLAKQIASGRAVPGSGIYKVAGTQANWMAYPMSVFGGGRLSASYGHLDVEVTVTAKATKEPLLASERLFTIVIGRAHAS